MGSVSEQTPRARRRGRLFRIAAASVVLLALAGYFLVQYMSGGGRGAPRCTVRAADGGGGGATYEFSPAQAANAATISAVGTTRGMPERAVTIALATALQESGLRNIDYGDRDSLGLFQQRPSQGWGTPKQIMDPVYSAGIFYDRLAEVPGYSRLPLTVAAQRVQLSGFPQAYAKHEPDAALLARALTGRTAATLTCTARGDGTPGDPARVRAELERSFGPGALPGTGKAGASAPAGGKGATIVVPVRTPDRAAGKNAAEQRGWELAHWAVAQSAGLRIERVSFAGREWTAGDSGDEWRDAADSEQKAGPDEVRIVTAH
ncbi:hypothetical protein [Streptomyces sp. SYSU K21746]